MPVFNIYHVTKYQYDRPVKESVNEIKLYPLADHTQEVLSQQVRVTGNSEIMCMADYWGNTTGMFNLMTPHIELVIESRLIIRTLGQTEPLLNSLALIGDLQNDLRSNYALVELSQPSEMDARQKINAIVDDFFSPGMTIAMIVSKCCEYIYKNFTYVKGITTINTTVAQILEHRSGVCQDFTHVMLELLRSLRIPARYVSGYICPNKNGMRGEGATHAWVEAWISHLGWTGIDPTNNVWVTAHHVKLAVGRNFNDCSPVRGTFKGPAHESLSVFVSIGYEDGATFEDITTVQLQPQKGLEELQAMERFAQQQ